MMMRFEGYDRVSTFTLCSKLSSPHASVGYNISLLSNADSLVIAMFTTGVVTFSAAFVSSAITALNRRDVL